MEVEETGYLALKSKEDRESATLWGKAWICGKPSGLPKAKSYNIQNTHQALGNFVNLAQF